VLQLIGILFKRKQESDKEKRDDPELYLLNALKKDCKKHALIFIDTYERVQAANVISQQKIIVHYSRPHEFLTASQSSLSLQDWLERLLRFFQQHGAVIIIAGRKIGCWEAQAHKIEHFNTEDILNFAGSSHYSGVQQAVAEHPEALLGVLTQLSFGGIPLWLQLATNFVSPELENGKTITDLAAMKNIGRELF
jgi:hypothetical protein